MAVWVVDTGSAAPVEGASVRVWGLEEAWQLTTAGVKQVASGTLTLSLTPTPTPTLTLTLTLTLTYPYPYPYPHPYPYP